MLFDRNLSLSAISLKKLFQQSCGFVASHISSLLSLALVLTLLSPSIAFTQEDLTTSDEALGRHDGTNSTSLSIAPLGNVSFDHQILETSLSLDSPLPPPVGNSSKTDLFYRSRSQFTTNFSEIFDFQGGYVHRITCASNFRTRKLTCELTLAPNPNGQLPNVVGVVLTDGRDPNAQTSTSQFAILYIDLTDRKFPNMTGYVYNTSAAPELPSWNSASMASSRPDPIFSTFNENGRRIVRELKVEPTIVGFQQTPGLQVRFALNTTEILAHQPALIPDSDLNFGPWLGVGFGSVYAAQLFTYVGAKVDYTFLLGPGGTGVFAERINGFIRSWQASGSTSISISPQLSCRGCTDQKTAFRSPFAWKILHRVLGSGAVSLPCNPRAVAANSPAVNAALSSDEFSAHYVAAQLSALSNRGERHLQGLLAPLGLYGEGLIDGDIIRLSPSSFVSASTNLTDLLSLANIESAACRKTSPEAKKLTEIFKKLEELTTGDSRIARPASSQKSAATNKKNTKAEKGRKKTGKKVAREQKKSGK